MAYKTCNKCGIFRPSDDFSPDKRNSCGLQGRCKECHREHKKSAYQSDPDRARKDRRKYYEEHKAQIAETAKNRREKRSLSQIDQDNAKKKEWYEKKKKDTAWSDDLADKRRSKKEEKAAYDREYRRKSADRLADYERNIRKRDAESTRAIKKAYKARRRSQERKGMSGPELQQWSEAQKKVCYWCDADCGQSFHIDHYRPLSKGGAHEANNLVISCVTCNLRKNAKDPYEFAQSMGRLF